jgi:hypothetical protein
VNSHDRGKKDPIFESNRRDFPINPPHGEIPTLKRRGEKSNFLVKLGTSGDGAEAVVFYYQESMMQPNPSAVTAGSGQSKVGRYFL